ncbi:MAG: MBL fold metallo-hydrolase [Treponema sp.]|jgi:glyoxylase-like metal-dependent hydrolase (beta-lactamase superfamily II)|nr:MBL fold metallo-hydrolase [Treponema sp.]
MKNPVFFGIALSLMAVTGIVHGQNTKTVMHSVGLLEVYLITEGERQGSPPRFVNANPRLIETYIPNGTVNSATNMFVVKTADGIVIIDTGYGAGILEGLQTLQIDPENVAAVILTHTHIDHVRGLLKNGVAAFPNAVIYLSAREADFWKRTGGERYTTAYKTVRTFDPVEIGLPGTAIINGITPFASYGHTPGHTVYMIESHNEKLLVIGDLVNVAEIQFPRPDIATIYDTDGNAAASSRRRVFEFAAQNGIAVSGMHLISPAIGLLTQNGAGFSFTELKQ